MSAQPKSARIITIDGPAGAGKSAVARRLAARLGLAFLDTGAMYRGVAAAALERRVDPADRAAAADLAAGLTLAFDFTDDPPALWIDGADVSARLRDEDVTEAVSDVAANPDIRRVLVRAQRNVVREHPGLVTEGRDQGSVVFPDAPVKFFLEASPEVRTRRRAEQLREAGRSVDERLILDQIIRRDERDAARPDGPLTCPPDALRIDSSAMTLDEVVERLARSVAGAESARDCEPPGAAGGGSA